MGSDTAMESRAGTRLPFLATAIIFGVPGIGALFGAIMLVGGLLQLPHAQADLATYRADPSCAASLTPGPAGACHVRDAVAVAVNPNADLGGRDAAEVRDNLVAQFPDGSRTSATFDGKAGVDFVHKVYPGDPIRVQTFRGLPVRVEGRGVVAETSFAPDVAAAGDRTMALTGGGLLAVLGLGGFMIYRRIRRTAAN